MRRRSLLDALKTELHRTMLENASWVKDSSLRHAPLSANSLRLPNGKYDQCHNDQKTLWHATTRCPGPLRRARLRSFRPAGKGLAFQRKSLAVAACGRYYGGYELLIQPEMGAGSFTCSEQRCAVLRSWQGCDAVPSRRRCLERDHLQGRHSDC
jgi:hypothetical protein